jgi:glycosyltransferase involved in cell wall biosynthesis
MNQKEKILIIIPAYNEETSIGKVVEDVKKYVPDADILVVNDGSTDNTLEKAKKNGALVITLPFNLGIGGAVQTGYKYAYEKGYDIAVRIDGDGQHNPREISKLINSFLEKKVDMIIGSRFIDHSEYKGSMMRKIGIYLLSKIISFLIAKKITDPTSGYIIANKRAIKLFAFNYPQDYPEPEALILLHKMGLKFEEVNVGMNKRYGGESSITMLRSIYYMIKVLLAIFIDCFKRKPFIV